MNKSHTPGWIGAFSYTWEHAQQLAYKWTKISGTHYSVVRNTDIGDGRDSDCCWSLAVL